MKIKITVKNSFVGVHCYPNAPEEVCYLKYPHRHNFNIESTIEVFHNDRELEFYVVQDSIDRFLKNIRFTESTSCEQIAEKVMNFLIDTYCNDKVYRDISVSVGEDGQNYCTVER